MNRILIATVGRETYRDAHCFGDPHGPTPSELALQVMAAEQRAEDTLQVAGEMVATLSLERNRDVLKSDPTQLAALFTLVDGWAKRLKEIEEAK